MNAFTRFKFFFWYFCHCKVPMIGYAKPKLIQLDDNDIVVKIPLTRRSKNHLNSLYFGALAIGADVAGGLHGFYHAKQLDTPISLVFKSFQAQFIKRPESDVFFIAHTGKTIKDMIQQAKQSGERINRSLNISAYTHYPDNREKVADFVLELSIKVLNRFPK